jgi:outer membrane protein assembly factor BamE (lipoprotein component of BamABCDE complex)
MHRMPAYFPRLVRLCAAVALCLSITACGWLMPPPQTRGNKVSEEQLKELVPGTSTKADVTALVGSPTQKAMFDDNTWLYITEVTRARIGRVPGILDQGVVVMTFDDRGVLANVKTVTQDQSVAVGFASRTTPSPGTEASFMQQLLGNVGRFSPAGTGSFSGGGGAPSGISSGGGL